MGLFLFMKTITCPFTGEQLEVKIKKELINDVEIDYYYYENSRGNQFTTDELDEINLKQYDKGRTSIN
jgi:hypothetical protein